MLHINACMVPAARTGAIRPLTPTTATQVVALRIPATLLVRQRLLTKAVQQERGRLQQILTQLVRYGLNADQIRLDMGDQSSQLELLVDLQVAVVDGVVVAVVEDDLQLWWRVLRLQDLGGDLVQRFLVYSVDGLVQR